MLQALLVVPGVRARVPLAAPPPLRRRVVQLSLACVALVASAGWWVADRRALAGASTRPYIGGSQNNSVLELIFGYNGFGRLTGNETGSVGGGGGQGGALGADRAHRACSAPSSAARSRGCSPPRSSCSSPASLWRGRLRRAPTACAPRSCSGAAGCSSPGSTFSLGRASSTPTTRSRCAGDRRARRHGRGDLVEAAARRRRARRCSPARRASRPIWAFVLLGRTPDWIPWLRGRSARGRRWSPARCSRAHLVHGRALVGLAVAAVGVLARRARGATRSSTASHRAQRRDPDGRARPSASGFGGPRRRGPAFGPAPAGGARQAAPPTFGGGRPGRATGGGTRRRSSAGCSTAARPSAALTELLGSRQRRRYTWVAATVGANQAAGYQLATGDPVMAIGGFNGTDPTPTLAQFQAYVARRPDPLLHRRRRRLRAAAGRGGTTASTSSQIASWVSANFTATTVGGVTVYDLTAATA